MSFKRNFFPLVTTDLPYLTVGILLAICSTTLGIILFFSSPKDHSKSQVGLPADFNYNQWKLDDSLKHIDSLETLGKKIDETIRESTSAGGITILKYDSLKKHQRVVDEQISYLKSPISAVLGYSNPKELKRKEIGHINVFLQIANSSEGVNNKLKITVSKQNSEENKNTDTKIYSENIIVYDSIDVSLVDPSSNVFTIVQIHNSNNQKIDKADGNTWHWTITTNTDEEQAELILKATPKTSDGGQHPLKEEIIPIKIKINSDSFVRKIIIWVLDHPEWIIGIFATTILSIIGFFAKRYFDNRKKHQVDTVQEAQLGSHRVMKIERVSESLASTSKTNEKIFKAGDKVKHKYYPGEMVVVEYVEERTVRCTWSQNAITKYDNFHENTLELLHRSRVN